MSKKELPKKKKNARDLFAKGLKVKEKKNKGIYTEYLDRKMSFEQLTEERKKQLRRISKLRDGRDVFVYAADGNKNFVPVNIDPSDLTPINDQIAVLNNDRLDFIIETNGGIGEVAEDIVKLLRSKFDEVNVIVPGTAKSAGTLIAMAGDDILMEPASSLGPIDAQIITQGKQFSADALIKGLEEIKEEVADTGVLNKAYIPILQSLSPGEIQHAQNALKFAQVLVIDWLVKYKFKNWTERKRDGEKIDNDYRVKRAETIAQKLSDHSKWLTHGRSIKIEDLREMELMVTDYAEIPELADAIRRYKILLEMTLNNSPIYKLYETSVSQIWRTADIIPNQPKPPQQIPNNLPSYDFDVECSNCKTKNKVNAWVQKPKKIKPGFIDFPQNNVIQCNGCNLPVNVLKLRQQIEKMTGKPII